jgi:8-oxo-dGTP pyrophosphatase MutT (NUDIX family)
MVRRYEKSSWGIVYRKKWDKVEILLLKWINSKEREEFVIPKWKIETWEVAKDTAIREISEETWLSSKYLEIIKFITKISYTFTAWYLKDTPIISKDVYLFLVRYNWNEYPNVRKEERFVDYKWADVSNLEKLKLRSDLISIISKNKPYFI